MLILKLDDVVKTDTWFYGPGFHIKGATHQQLGSEPHFFINGPSH